jgi:RNA polymerase sigma-70 factor (ECF subfamily)
VIAVLTGPGEPPTRPASAAKSRGDDQLADEVFDRYAPVIYRYAFQHLGNRADAEDVTTQVFLQLAEAGLQPLDETTWRILLFRAARAAIADTWRRQYRKPSLPPGWLNEEDGPDEISSARLTAERISRCFDRLDPALRRVLQLRLLEGCSLAETALALGISEFKVQLLQHEALRLAATIVWT